MTEVGSEGFVVPLFSCTVLPLLAVVGGLVVGAVAGGVLASAYKS